MAQTAEIQRLLTDTMIACSGCPLAEAQSAFFGALRDFCYETNAWQQDFTVPIVASVRSYTLAPVPTGATVIRALNLYDSADVDKKPVANFKMTTPPTIELQLTPNAAHTWVATVALQPLDPVNGDGDPQGWPVYLLQKYIDTLTHGAIGRLMTQASKPWTNDKLGLFRLRSYVQGRTKARTEVFKANTSNTQAWNYPQSFAPGGRQTGV